MAHPEHQTLFDGHCEPGIWNVKITCSSQNANGLWCMRSAGHGVHHLAHGRDGNWCRW